MSRIALAVAATFATLSLAAQNARVEDTGQPHHVDLAIVEHIDLFERLGFAVALVGAQFEIGLLRTFPHKSSGSEQCSAREQWFLSRSSGRFW